MAKIKMSTDELLSGITGNKHVDKNNNEIEYEKVETMAETKKKKPIELKRINGSLKQPHQLGINIEEEDFQKLDDYCSAEKKEGNRGASVGLLIRDVIHDWIEKNL